MFCWDLEERIERCFTGKERDQESGNDYFGARYYASTMGRFLSPDWSAQEEPVPYAKMDNPQSLNLYSYVLNNPLISVDTDGHVPLSWGGFVNCGEEGSQPGCGAGTAEDLQPRMDAQLIIESNKLFSQLTMTISSAGVDFIKGWEGWNGTYDKETAKWLPTDDGFGNLTIGWGHNCGKCADFKDGITKEQGDKLLTKDIRRFEKAVNGLGNTTLRQQQFDGLVAFGFNVRNFAGSTLFSNVAAGTAPVSEDNFTSYGHARVNGQLVEVPSLMRRRESEWNVYAYGVYNSSH